MTLRVQSRHHYFPATLTQSQTLSAKNAAALDKELMSTGAFSIDQLMELAGLSVSQAGMRKTSSIAIFGLRSTYSRANFMYKFLSYSRLTRGGGF